MTTQERTLTRRCWADVVVGHPPPVTGGKEQETEQLSEGSRQEHLVEEGGDDEDISDASPKNSRRRRRRHRRKNGGNSSGTSNFGDGLRNHGEAFRRSKNVVTWSDLCADSVIETLLPGSGSPHTQVAVQSRAVDGRLAADLSAADLSWGSWQPQYAATPIQPQAVIFVGATPSDQVAEDVPPVLHPSEIENRQEWTGTDSEEMRRWLCKTFSGVPGALDASPAEHAEMLRKFSQQAYED